MGAHPLALFLIGVAATILVGLVVRFFPFQEYPEDNAQIAMIAFAVSYFLTAIQCLAFFSRTVGAS